MGKLAWPDSYGTDADATPVSRMADLRDTADN